MIHIIYMLIKRCSDPSRPEASASFMVPLSFNQAYFGVQFYGIPIIMQLSSEQ